MTFISQLNRLIEPIRNRIRMVVSRAIVSLIDDSKAMQIVQLSLMHKETKDNVERVQNYGFTSHPLEDSEAVVLFVNGNRDHGMVIAVDSTKYRIKNLPKGGVAVYDYDGNSVKLTKDNGIVVESPNKKVVIKAFGNIEIGNTSLKKLVNEEFQSMFNSHVHNFPDATWPGGVLGPVIMAVTGTPANLTGTGGISTGSNPAVPPTGLPGISLGSNELTSKVKAE